MQHNIYVYLLVMAGATYLVRVLPLTLFRRQVKSRFLRSFLYYVPYATLAVMTFPAMVEATRAPAAGAAAFVIGGIAAWKGAGLFPVTLLCCTVVYAAEMLLL